MKAYTVGVDFGTLSARAVLTDTENGRELACASMDYPHGVMDKVLTDHGVALPADFALQDPADYLLALEAVLAAVMRKASVAPDEVVGIGIDFTTCTLLSVTEDGTPLCHLPEFEKTPLAYALLWKHHAAAPYAKRLTEIARERGEKFLDPVGGSISEEWVLPKICQVFFEAPEVYRGARYFIEAGDWIVWQLCGKQARSYPLAASKALFRKDKGYPDGSLLAEMDEALRHVVRDKLLPPVAVLGKRAGTVSEKAAARFGLKAGAAVGPAMPDAHVAASALGIQKSGDMFAILGTSGCFFLVDEREIPVRGICGTLPDTVLPGLFGYEAGLCCFGDHFAYAAKNLTSPDYVKEAKERGIPMLPLLFEKASEKAPGESGVLALNWFNGNRNTLCDPQLSGALIGVTLQTAPEDILRALVEATAFGWRSILERYTENGIEISRIVASGGIALKNAFCMQLYADVLGRDIEVAATREAPALGSAIVAAVAAGCYPDLPSAMNKMSSEVCRIFHPVPAHSAIYNELYAEYKRLHDYFGKGENQVMHRLRHLAAEQKRS